MSYDWNTAEFGHLLQRYRNTYRLPESGEDVERHYRQILHYVEQRVRQARLDERSWQAALPDKLEAWITDVIRRVVKEVAESADEADAGNCQQIIRENATTCLLGTVRLAMGERERRARLDEHKILAALDEEGKKQRYMELAQEG